MKKTSLVLFILSVVAGMGVLLSGCAVVTVIEDLQNPFLITITWDGTELSPDAAGELPSQCYSQSDAVVVEVAVSDEFGCDVVPESCEWYLEDELIEKDTDSVELAGTLAVGVVHQLNVLVKKGAILSSESVQFQVIE
jgi:hypothetical protein